MPIHSSPATGPGPARGARLALAVAILLAWVNLALAGRWATEPGALHGPRLLPYIVGLAAATLTLLAGTRWAAAATRAEAAAVGLSGALMLGAAFLTAFPVGQWNQIPFEDDWPGLLQLTLNGLDTLRHGAVVGWQWAFLGGYHTSADLSQSLAVPAWLPIALAGPTIGFHLFLVIVTAAIPMAAWYDVRASDGGVAGGYAAGLSSVVTGGYFATVMHSGMGNSTAGAAMVAVALAASHAARRGRRWGGPVLTFALALALYSHAAFYLYGAVCLGVEALFYRDGKGAMRSAVALGAAFLAALPLHWELLRYPSWFFTNNLYFDQPPAFDWTGFVRQVWYATEMLAMPGRWFNDYGGLTYVFLIVILWMAWRDRTRAGFYAWATVAIVITLRLNSPQLGLVAGRQLHLLPVLVAPALAGFIVGHAPGGRAGRVALAALVALFVAVPYTPVRHLPDVRAFNPALVDQLQQASGQMVLLENSPHWDMISDPAARTERSRFDVHYEALLPAATGKRFFGQPQDGYHRSRFRGHSLAGGGFRGLAIGQVPPDVFTGEMRRWGVQHLFVWSHASKAYVAALPGFTPRWKDGDWQEYSMDAADTRSVVTAAGRATLEALTPVGGRVVLRGVPAGTPVVVRTHYHPAWTASADGRPVALRAEGDQIAFDSPFAEGVVQLSYDRRPWLTALALLALMAGVAGVLRIPA